MATFLSSDKGVSDPSGAPEVPEIPASSDNEDLPVVEVEAEAADEVISEEQMPSTVVITGLPLCSESDIRAGLEESLGLVILKAIFQRAEEKQHAVVVLNSPEAAEEACAKSGSSVLGSPVVIVRAVQLQAGVEDGESSTISTARRSNSLFLKAKATTVGVTASAMVVGSSVMKKVQEADKKTGISSSVNASFQATKCKVTEIDSQLGISAGVRSAAKSTATAVKSIDEKYDISGRTTRAASDATAVANKALESALKNETVNRGWGFMKRVASSAVSSAKNFATTVGTESKDVYAQAKAKAKARGSSGENSGGNAAAAVVEGELVSSDKASSSGGGGGADGAK